MMVNYCIYLDGVSTGSEREKYIHRIRRNTTGNNHSFVTDHLGLSNGSWHFTHSSPWTKFEKSISKHSPMTRVFLACRKENGVQKICSPSRPRIQYPAQCIFHPSISSLFSSNSMSHTRIVPSFDADINCLPSRKKATEGT